jgi:Diacylglycerol acyltransferase
MSIYPLFLVFGLHSIHAVLHWWFAGVSISLYTIVYLFFKTTDSKLESKSSVYQMTRSACLTSVIYLPAVSSTIVYFMFRSVETCVPWIIISLMHILYTNYSYNGNPELTGCRELSPTDLLWPWLRSIDDHVQRFFSGRVIKEVDLPSDKLYIFGYHPHGVLPVSLFWLRNSDDWSALFPGIVFSILTASSLHLVPVMRDFLQWKGGREVSRESFDYSLSRKRNVLVVPGGQTELMLSRSNQNQIKLSIRHQGFIRIAIERGVDLVPVFSFGENDVLDNIYLPVLQKWFLKRLGAALPFHPHSGWLLPVPRKQNISIVVGTPIQVKQISNPNASEVKVVLDLYLRELHRIFEKHKNTIYSIQDRQLLFIDGCNCIYDIPSI